MLKALRAAVLLIDVLVISLFIFVYYDEFCRLFEATTAADRNQRLLEIGLLTVFFIAGHFGSKRLFK
jgi:hypothetical protein